MLLSFVELGLSIGLIQRNDPDVIVGHEFLGTGLETILQRMKELKADHWSRIGRIRRTQLKIGMRWYSNAKYLTGRLVSDLSSDGAKVKADAAWGHITSARVFLTCRFSFIISGND